MSLLKTEPPDAIRSLPELFALAHALEEEAASRYAELAGSMESLGLGRVAAVFRELVEEERGHAHHVEEWARGATGRGPEAAQVRWAPPETFDEEEARGIANSHIASAYRALSMAVRNEERAFALWSYIAAFATAPDIQRAAERMAQEELRHAALLRRERRRAWREERGGDGREERGGDGREERRRAGSEARAGGAVRQSPLARAVAAERRLAVVLAALPQGAPGSATWRRLGGEAAVMAGEAAQLLAEDGAGAVDGDVPAAPGDMEEALRLAERASEAYLDATDAAREDSHLGVLHTLSERAVARIALMRREIAAHVAGAG